jgi:hypothetical protein
MHRRTRITRVWPGLSKYGFPRPAAGSPICVISLSAATSASYAYKRPQRSHLPCRQMLCSMQQLHPLTMDSSSVLGRTLHNRKAKGYASDTCAPRMTPRKKKAARIIPSFTSQTPITSLPGLHKQGICRRGNVHHQTGSPAVGQAGSASARLLVVQKIQIERAGRSPTIHPAIEMYATAPPAPGRTSPPYPQLR